MALVPLLMKYAAKLGLLDAPDPRKVHEKVVPRSGGVAIVAGVMASLILFWPSDQITQTIVIGSLIIALFGFLDDRSDLDFRWKFFGQIIAAGLVVSAGLRIDLWPFFGIEPLPVWLTFPISIVFIVGVTNAMNLSDGLDGLAGGASIITLAALAWLFWQAGNAVMVTYVMAILGAVSGFLRYNNHPAVVFMGDTGSQFLGFLTACLSIYLCQRTDVALNPALLLLLVGLPILDTFSVMYWRLKRGLSPFHPDRNHFHHRLLDFGLRHYEAVSAIYVLQGALVLLAVLIRYQGDYEVVGSYLVFALFVVGFFRWARRSDFTIRKNEVDASIEPRVERRNLLLRRFDWLPKFMERLTEVLAAGFLIFGAIYAQTVREEVGALAAGVAALAMVGGVMPPNIRRNVWRVVIFMAGVGAVYAMLEQPRFGLLQNWHINAYMIGLGICLVFTIRLTRRDVFHTTPLDVLIVFFVLATVFVATLVGRSETSTQFADTAIRLAVFFYVGEYLNSRQGESYRILPMAAMGALMVVAARGLMV